MISSHLSPNNNDVYTEYEDIRDYPYDLRNQHYDDDASTDEHTFQLDYTNPISGMHNIDFGAKYILRNNKSESQFFNEYNGSYQAVESLTDKFTNYTKEFDMNDRFAEYIKLYV